MMEEISRLVLLLFKWYSKARVLQQDRQCAYNYIEARSRNLFCRGKARRIACSKCVSVALVIQHAKRMRRITLTSAACLALSCLYTLHHKRHDFWRKVNECKIRVLIFSTTFSKTFLILRRIQRGIFVNLPRSSCKRLVFLVKFYRNFNFLA
jgi:hypothetical protein